MDECPFYSPDRQKRKYLLAVRLAIKVPKSSTKRNGHFHYELVECDTAIVRQPNFLELQPLLIGFPSLQSCNLPDEFVSKKRDQFHSHSTRKMSIAMIQVLLIVSALGFFGNHHPMPLAAVGGNITSSVVSFKENTFGRHLLRSLTLLFPLMMKLI